MVMHNYADFVFGKSQLDGEHGFAPVVHNGSLLDFQSAMVDWACRKGRAAIFADCGMGKTLMQLAYADNVVRHTNRPVLVLTPLAVGAQTIAEGAKFGIETQSAEAFAGKPGIYVTNYERLHKFDRNDFVGCVCDESSILKSFDGATKQAVTDFMRKMPYRLLCTATAAPNDYTELGTSSEALGYLGHIDMLNRFFTNKEKNSFTGRAWAGKGGEESFAWTFKGHAEESFWRWVCSWARALRKPSDLGFDDSRFVLPRLIERQHVVESLRPREGWLFAEVARGLAEQREERRRTLAERCDMAASLVADTGKPAVVWCYLNDEADRVERAVPGAIQVSGKDSDDEKVEKFQAFASGQARVIVIKPVIGAWGLNWQHCAHMTMFAGYSFEQYYQSIRRCWRFGQTSDVVVDNVVSDGEGEILEARKRKAAQTDKMFADLVQYMREGMKIDRKAYGTNKSEVPSWLCSTK